MPGRPLTVRCLSFHASYKCQNSGVCCSSGWEIAVEEQVEIRIHPRLLAASTRLPNGPEGFRSMANPPAGCRTALRQVHSTGSCWFRDDEARLCSIHREFGEDSLPSACRHFPRVCVLEPGVVSVSLSHYCPTAAELLFRSSTDFAIVEGPKAFPMDWPFEGLDTRNAYPPFLRPGVLLDFDSLRVLEDKAVAALASRDLWSGLATIEAAVEAARSWTLAMGPLVDHVRSSFAAAVLSAKLEPKAVDPRPTLLAALTGGTPPSVGLPDFRPVRASISSGADLALRKYLASRLIAAWITFQAEDLRTAVKYLRLCLDTVLLFESARGPGESEATRWKEAIRSADLWILHSCDPELLARNLR